ncbi:AfsR/SARP family transcriptional regulator [Streptomonospora salina]|uniref:Putative ATPase/DNA-binding SARP family transcriptional activator n=1 Tax=Streptomonospora salina TaxID=104205 RepID=A0A841EG59_9ACTN|nr:BTAD domain-containing putative transcriptional regulator [Streptomonospora salina]MBB6001284.1 putative ATPase/DNA-binding SARP family transcriptional activator [Streptomonospora salina]
MRFSILGPLAVSSADGADLPVGGARLRRLLVLLLLTPGRTVGSERLVRGIWGDGAVPENAGNALQALVSRLRRALGGDAPVHGDPGGYRLQVEPASVDLHRFEDLARRGRGARGDGDPERAEELLGQALALWRGPALAELGASGAAGDTVLRLDASHRTVLLERLRLQLDLGRHDDALPEAEALAAHAPHDERPAELLVCALAAAGRQAEALTAYDRLRRGLAEDLGIDPSPHMQRLQLRLLRGELHGGSPGPGPAPAAPHEPAAAAAASPEPVAPDAPPTSEPRAVKRLPHVLTSFVAREDEVARVGALLDDERLVTLIGPGGAGKTRLSIEAGSRFVEDAAAPAERGVWFVELAPLRDGADIPHALLSGLGLSELPGMSLSSGAPPSTGDVLDRVVDHLGGRDALLILDNCEHLVGDAAQTAERLLARCPRLRVLATSREPLGIAGERLLAVPSLALPPETAGADRAGAYAAVRLFAERARAVDPGFTVGEHNAAHVVRICRELDGLPLALELAAARVRAMSVTHLAARLSDRFRLLTNGNRFALPQHQTLQAVVDWSWELLDSDERTLLHRLSVFAGGAALDAVEHVWSPGSDGGRDVWPVLFALVDKSLVSADVGDDGGEPRYRMLETVRAYGAQRLAESGEEAVVRRAHADYTLALWSRVDPHLRGPDQLGWLERLRLEHDNLTAALRWTIDSGDLACALDLLHTSCWYWQMGNSWSDLVRWCGELLRAAGDRPPAGRTVAYAACLAVHSAGADITDQEISAKGLLRAEELLAESGDRPEDHPGLLQPILLLGMFGYDRRARIARLDRTAADHPDPWVRAAARLFGGLLALHTGSGAEGSDRVFGALDSFRAIGDRWGTAHALTMAAGLGRFTDAGREMDLLEEGDALADEIGLSATRAQFAARRGIALAASGRVDAARSAVKQAHALTADSETRLICRVGDAEVACAAGDPAAAYDIAMSLGADVAAMNDIVRRQVEPGWLALLSRTAMALGDRRAALAHAAAAWAMVAPQPTGLACAEVCEQLAEVLHGEWPERAAVLLGCAESVRGLANEAGPAVARIRARARDALGADGFDRAYGFGAEYGPAGADDRVGAWLRAWGAPPTGGAWGAG